MAARRLPQRQGFSRLAVVLQAGAGEGRAWWSGPGRPERTLEIWRGEADLSTEQARSQAPARLSRAYGNRRRPQGRGGAPRPRPQAAFRL